MNLLPRKAYGIKNKNGDVGTIVLLETTEKIEYWRKNLIKWKKELKSDKEYFEDKGKIYLEIKEKTKDEKTLEDINQKIETTHKILETIRNKCREIEDLEIVTIKQNGEEHAIETVCNIRDFIPEWEEI